MNFKDITKRVSVFVTAVMRSWPPQHRCHTDNERQQTENGTQQKDAGDKLPSSYPSVSPQQTVPDIVLTLEELRNFFAPDSKVILGEPILPGRGGDGYFEMEYHPTLIIKFHSLQGNRLTQEAIDFLNSSQQESANVKKNCLSS